MKRVFFLILIIQLGSLASVHAQLNSYVEVPLCASPEDVERVREAYEQMPGEPMTIIAGHLKLPEVQVTTALPKENSIGTKTTPEMVKDIWTSIDQWGADTEVRLMFTMGGQHAYHFPSLVPMRQEDLDDGWLDIYADKGDGVHGHLWLKTIRSVHAVDIPGPDNERLRAISFYTSDGNLAIGVYASRTHKKFFSKAAVEGFAKTWKLIASMSRACE